MAMSLRDPAADHEAASVRQLEGLIAGEADETVGHGGKMRDGGEAGKGGSS